jgi:hypothetical protein
MRTRHSILALGMAFLLGGCSSAGVAPKVKVMEGFPGSKPRTIAVQSEQDQASVVASLEQAGFQVKPDSGSAAFLLRVSVGTNRAKASCGRVNNVRYSLDTAGSTVLEIQARGWTGTCSPNVYDEMSAALAQAFPKGS